MAYKFDENETRACTVSLRTTCSLKREIERRAKERGRRTSEILEEALVLYAEKRRARIDQDMETQIARITVSLEEVVRRLESVEQQAPAKRRGRKAAG
jgi:hypothetical protein